MSPFIQKTIANPIKIRGVGLHSGKKVQIKIFPAGPNNGIIFKRTDLKRNNFIIPNLFNVSNATLCTTLTNEYGVSVSTIEHLMGALYGKGIDNAVVETDSEELPILDDSAKEFIKKIEETTGNHIALVSYGPDRNQTFKLRKLQKVGIVLIFQR